MAFIHKFNIETMKTEFRDILVIYQEIQNKRTLIQGKLAELKEIYNKLIKDNNKKIFLFCLDSFYFQYKVLNHEMENLSRYISLINNRMYGDYYKLYNIIILQSTQCNIDTKKIADQLKKYPTYKDLEPFHEYDIDHTKNIHQEILVVINQLYSFYSNKESSINEYNGNTNIGISIANFINTLEYENTLVREQIGLYSGYVTFFHNTQRTYLSKLLSKVRNFQQEIEEDILVNGRPKASAFDMKPVITSIDTFFEPIAFEECELQLEYTEIETFLNESEEIIEKTETLIGGLANSTISGEGVGAENDPVLDE
jgi:hypothetical protein